MELNSFEFLIHALLYFESEARGTLDSSELSSASPVESVNYRFDINAIKSEILEVPPEFKDHKKPHLLSGRE